MLAVDENLWNGASAVRALDHLVAQRAAPFQHVGFVFDALVVEQLLRPVAIRAGRLHVDFNARHACSLLYNPAPQSSRVGRITLAQLTSSTRAAPARLSAFAQASAVLPVVS